MENILISAELRAHSWKKHWGKNPLYLLDMARSFRIIIGEV